MSNYAIVHWSPLSGNSMEVVNFSGNVAPTEKHPGSLLEGFTQTQISTLAVKDKWLVAGGFQGELICKQLDQPGVASVPEQHMMRIQLQMLLKYMNTSVVDLVF